MSISFVGLMPSGPLWAVVGASSSTGLSPMELPLQAKLTKLKGEQGRTQARIAQQIKTVTGKIKTVKHQRVREKQKRQQQFEALKKKEKAHKPIKKIL